MTIAESFKSVRLSRDVSQDELADMLEVTKTMISQIERGCRLPSINLLIDTARCLHCTTDSLLGLDQEDED